MYKRLKSQMSLCTFVVMYSKIFSAKSKEPVRPLESSALALDSNSHGDGIIMTYGDRLKRWAVIRLLPNMQRVTVARFVKRSDADGYAQALCRLEPNAQLSVVFDAPEDAE